MTKNMTRKGLALGSTIALAASALVGFAAPAQASTYVVIPSSGTSTSFISGETFSVKVLGQFASSAALRWEIAGIDTANETVTATVSGGQSVVGTTTQTVTATTVATTAGGNALGVAVGAAETASVTVRAYVESGDAVGFNAAYDTSYSAPITLNFIKVADLTTTATIGTATEGDTTISASILFNGINNEQVATANVGAYFTKGDGSALYATATATAAALTSSVVTVTAANTFVTGQTVSVDLSNNAFDGTFSLTGATASAFTYALAVADIPSATVTGTAVYAPVNAVKSNIAWSATDSFAFTSSAVLALVKGTGLKVQPLFKTGGTPLYTSTVGTAVTALVATRVAASITAASVVSVTANAANSSLLNSTFQVKATVKDGATPAAAVAGNTVTATITTDATLSGTAGSVVSLAVNGTTYTATATLPGASGVAKVSLTTDANGEVALTLATAGYTAGQIVTVSFVTENLSAATVTSTQAAATYTVSHSAFTTTTDGNSVALAVVVYDQFGGRPANNYDVRAVFDASNGNYAAQATTASTSATGVALALVGGAASVVLTDNGTGVGVNSYDVTVETRAVAGGYSGALNGTGTTTFDVHIKTAASLAAGSVTSNGTQDATTKVYAIAGPVALSLVDYASYDSTSVLGTAPSALTGALTAQNLTGTVSTTASATASATAVPGASVTLSGSNLFFNNGGIYQAGSITVAANTSGVYSVNVYSHTAGKQTVTISSGSATATTTIVFAAAADTTGTVLTIDAPAYVPAGSTVIAKAYLVDKYGNAVAVTDNSNSSAGDFSLTYSGPGLAVTASAAVLDSDGKAQVAYFLGSNDSGTITITAKYDANGDEDYTDVGDLTVVKTLTIGSAPVVADTKVNVGTFKGYVALYAKGYEGQKMSAIVAGKWIVVESLASDFERVVRFTGAGYTITTKIYIDGEQIGDAFTTVTK
jgi:hypothetical protein